MNQSWSRNPAEQLHSLGSASDRRALNKLTLFPSCLPCVCLGLPHPGADFLLQPKLPGDLETKWCTSQSSLSACSARATTEPVCCWATVRRGDPISSPFLCCVFLLPIWLALGVGTQRNQLGSSASRKPTLAQSAALGSPGLHPVQSAELGRCHRWSQPGGWAAS